MKSGELKALLLTTISDSKYIDSKHFNLLVSIAKVFKTKRLFKSENMSENHSSQEEKMQEFMNCYEKRASKLKLKYKLLFSHSREFLVSQICTI